MRHIDFERLCQFGCVVKCRCGNVNRRVKVEHWLTFWQLMLLLHPKYWAIGDEKLLFDCCPTFIVFRCCCCWFCLLILFICKFSINHPLKMSLDNQQIAFPNIYSAFRLSDRPFKVVKFANKFLFSSSLFFLRAHFNHVIISIGLISQQSGKLP